MKLYLFLAVSSLSMGVIQTQALKVEEIDELSLGDNCWDILKRVKCITTDIG